jgi:hypothetical protein
MTDKLTSAAARDAAGFHSVVEARLSAAGIPPASYDLWMVGCVHDDEGTRFDGSPDFLYIADFAVIGTLDRGTGGAVLREALRVADEMDLTLVINPQAQRKAPEGALGQAELEGWYARMGFVREDEDFMVRAPGTPIPDRSVRVAPVPG